MLTRKLLFWLIFVCLSLSTQLQIQAQSATSLRIISFNVWYGFTQVPERKPDYLQWMQEQEPDIVSLQELNEYTPEQLAADAATWGHPYSVLLKEEGFPTGVTSRYPIEDVQRFRDGFHHGLMRVKIQGLYLYIIHLHPGEWRTRHQEMDMILDDIATLGKDARIMLAGDFNTLSRHDRSYYQHGRLEDFFTELEERHGSRNLKDDQLDYAVLDKLYAQGFIDAEYQLREDEYSFTGSFPTRIAKEGYHGDQRRLDYVFLSPNLADNLIGATIPADDTTWILSDHLPVIVDLQFN